MASNFEIAPELLEEAVKIGKHRSKQAAVEAALIEYVDRRKQQEVVEFFGEIEFDSEYDYKAARKQRKLL